MRTKAMLEEELAMYKERYEKLTEQTEQLDIERASYKIAMKKIERQLGMRAEDSSSSSEAASIHAAGSLQAQSVTLVDTGGASFWWTVASVPRIRGLIGNLNTLPSYGVNYSSVVPSQHTKKMRALQFSKTNANHFVTCADDGRIRMWQLSFDSEKPMANNVLSADVNLKSFSPEDIAVNPVNDSVVVVYGLRQELQVVSLDQQVQEGEKRVIEVQDSPHSRGISKVAFMPPLDNNPLLVTAGKQHQVATWRCVEGEWDFNPPYKLHTNLITGLCGLPCKSVIVTSGRDKRVFGYDYQHGKEDFKQTLDVPCLGVASNLSDHNLLCIQTGVDEAQLRIYDIRERDQCPVLSFGWKSTAESKKKASILAPVWSPNGLLLSAGSAESEVRIFDIRYSVQNNPTLVISLHTKKVFKVDWAPNHPLLVSISMDRNIGLHKLSGM